MPIEQLPKGVIKQSGKFLGLFGMAYLAGSPQLAPLAGAALGLGEKSIGHFMGMISNMVSGYSSEAFTGIFDEAKFHINHDVQKEINSAYESTFQIIEDNIIEGNLEGSGNFFNFILAPAFYKKIKANRKLLRENFFSPVLAKLMADSEITSMLDKNKHLNPSLYLADIILENLNEIEFLSSDKDPQIFTEEICKQFGDIFPSQFLAGIKRNEQARIGYFKHLLEGLTLQGEFTNKQLGIINQIALQNGISLTDLKKELKDINPLLKKIDDKIAVFENSLKDVFEKNEILLNEIKDLIALNHAPVLTIDQREYNDNHDPNLYHFRYQFTRMTGRNEEKNKIRDFIYEDRINGKRFSWCLMTGEGGSGKSRLAQELALEAKQTGYYAGFLSLSQGNMPDWNRWNPKTPVLLIIDYAFANRSLVLECIRTLENLNSNDGPPLRVLLLERTSSKNWEEEVKGIPAVNSTQFPGIELTPLEKENQWKIIADVVNKLNPGKLVKLESEKDSWLNILDEIDSKHRPLFTFLAAVALSEGDNIRNWNKHKLLSHVNSRMIQFWNRYPAYKQHSTLINQLLLINTLARFMQLSEAEDICYDLNPNVVFTDIEEVYIAFTENHIGENTGKLFRTGIQPDILGEYFILDQLASLLEGGQQRKLLAEKLVNFSWNLPYSSSSWTIWLAYSDFQKFKHSDEAESQSMINAVDFLISEVWMNKFEETPAGQLSELYSNIVYHHYSEDKNADTMTGYIDRIYALHLKFPQNPFILENYFKAIRNYAIISVENVPTYIQSCFSLLNSEAYDSNSNLLVHFCYICCNHFDYNPTEDFIEAELKIKWFKSKLLYPEYNDVISYTLYRYSLWKPSPEKMLIDYQLIRGLLNNSASEDVTNLFNTFCYYTRWMIKQKICPTEFHSYLQDVISIHQRLEARLTIEHIRGIQVILGDAVVETDEEELLKVKPYLDFSIQLMENNPEIFQGRTETVESLCYGLWQFLEKIHDGDAVSCYNYFKKLDAFFHNDGNNDSDIAGIWLLSITIPINNQPDDKDLRKDLLEIFLTGMSSTNHLYCEKSASFMAFTLSYYINKSDGEHEKSDIAFFKKTSEAAYEKYKSRDTLRAIVSVWKLKAELYPNKEQHYMAELQKSIDQHNEKENTEYTLEELMTFD